MKRVLSIVTRAVLVWVILLLAARSEAAQPYAKVPEEWNRPVQPFRIVGNVYYVGSSELASYLITTPKGHILLDSGAAETVPQILENVGKLGFRAEEIRMVINSHAHFDHAGGIRALKRLTGAKIYLSREDMPLAARGGLDDPHFGDSVPFEPFKPDVVVSDRKPVRFGGVELVPHITAGHTQGCTTWTMKSESHDVLFLCSITAPGYKLIGNEKYPDAVSDYRRTFERLESLHPDVFLAAHGSFFGLLAKIEKRREGVNPFIDESAFPTYLAAAKKSIEEQIAKQQREDAK